MSSITIGLLLIQLPFSLILLSENLFFSFKNSFNFNILYFFLKLNECLLTFLLRYYIRATISFAHKCLV